MAVMNNQGLSIGECPRLLSGGILLSSCRCVYSPNFSKFRSGIFSPVIQVVLVSYEQNPGNQQ